MTEIVNIFANDQWYSIAQGIGALLFVHIALGPLRKRWTSPRHVHHHTDARRAKDN
jgi:hypothetical protein